MPLRITCATWNVNSKEPGQESLESWLCVTPDPPDIIAVTLQEIVELSDVSQYIGLNRGRESESMAFSWSRLIRSTLMSHDRYRGVEFTVLEYHKLVGTMLCVLVQTKLLGQISGVYCGSASTGVMGMANKGACAIRFNLHGTNRTRKRSLCFVGCHLAAHQKEVEKRNADVATILQSATFDLGLPSDAHTRARRASLPPGPTARPSAISLLSGSSGDSREGVRTSRSMAHGVPLSEQFRNNRNHGMSILDHDIVFWAGDLNYRLAGVDADLALRKIQQRNFDHLLQSDQLTLEKTHRRAFRHFHEAAITFPPSYKFVPGTDKYDCAIPVPGEQITAKHPAGPVKDISRRFTKRVATLAGFGDSTSEKVKPKKKVRVPAWCDRILWKSAHNVQQLSYSISMGQKGSDHKPVSACFILPFLDVARAQDRPPSFTFAPPVAEKTEKPAEAELARNPTAAPGALSHNPYMRAIPEEVECACVTIPYDPRGPDDLRLQVGDLVEVLSGTTKDGMAVGWTASAGSRVGFFPVSHVRTLGLYRADPKTGRMQEAASKALALRHAKIQAEVRGLAKSTAGAVSNQGYSLIEKAAGAFSLMQKLMYSARSRATASGLLSPTVELLSNADLVQDGPVQMRAKYTYHANADDELSFKKGQVLTVTSRVSVEHGWWVANGNDHQGLVPANYLENLDEVDTDSDSEESSVEEYESE